MMAETWGLASLFVVMIVQVIIPPIPAELVVVAAGRQYGVPVATLVAGSGLWAGSYLVYLIGARIRRRFYRFFRRDKVDLLIQRLKQHELVLLLVRILPYNPSDAISYAAGIIRVGRTRFIAITGFTSFIRCLTLTLLGERITSVKHMFVVVGVLALSALIANAIVAGRRS